MRNFIMFLFMGLCLQGCFLDFFKVVSASFSKEYCSCRYVEKLDKSYCKDYAMQVVPVWSFEEDDVNKKILSSGLGFSTEAQYFGVRQGCRIIK